MTQNLRKGNTFSQICVAKEFKPAGVPDAVPGTVQYTSLLVLRVLLPRTENTAQFARSREISALQVGMCAATRTEQHRGGAATPPTRTHALRTRTLWPSRCLNRFMLAAARAFGAHVHRSPDAHHLRSRCVAPTVQITMVLCRWHFEADWDGAHGGAGVVSSFTRAMEPASGPVSDLWSAWQPVTFATPIRVTRGSCRRSR